jgi:ankyrin repeat protein
LFVQLKLFESPLQLRQTPLHIAASMGRTATVGVLLNAGAQKDAEDDVSDHAPIQMYDFPAHVSRSAPNFLPATENGFRKALEFALISHVENLTPTL